MEEALDLSFDRLLMMVIIIIIIIMVVMMMMMVGDTVLIYCRISRLKNAGLSIKYTNFDSHLNTSNERMSVFK